MKNNILKFALLAFFWMIYTLPLIAQPVDPPGEDDPFEPEDPTPIDDWMVLLILASAATGIYFRMKYGKGQYETGER